MSLFLFCQDQRVPADMVFLRTTERNGSCFIRTDQLDGETDWKLRLAVPAVQILPSDMELYEINAQVYAEEPKKDIHGFIGTFSRVRKPLLVDRGWGDLSGNYENYFTRSAELSGLGVGFGEEPFLGKPLCHMVSRQIMSYHFKINISYSKMLGINTLKCHNQSG